MLKEKLGQMETNVNFPERFVGRTQHSPVSQSVPVYPPEQEHMLGDDVRSQVP